MMPPTENPTPLAPWDEEMFAEARNPLTSLDRLVELPWPIDSARCRILLDNPNICPTNEDGKRIVFMLELLAERFPVEVQEHRVFVLHALTTPAPEMEHVVTKIITRTNDSSLIERLYRNFLGSFWVRQATILNTCTSTDILRELSAPQFEPVPRLRMEVATNPNVPTDVLRSMINEEKEPDLWVRMMARTVLEQRGVVQPYNKLSSR